MSAAAGHRGRTGEDATTQPELQPIGATVARWISPTGRTGCPADRAALLSAAIIVPLLAAFAVLGHWTYLVFPPGTYVTFHDVLELFAVLVALSIFGVGWFTYAQSRDQHALFLACAFLAIGLGDLVHTLSYVGRPSFVTANAPDKASWVWIAVRLFAAGAFLGAAAVGREARSPWLRPRPLLAGAGVTALAFVAVALLHDRLPPVYLAGVGQTGLKRGAELAVVLLEVLAVAAYRQRQVRTGEAFVSWLAAGLMICALSEVPFAFYRSATDSLNALGHLLKVAGFALIYRGLFIASVQEPYRREAEGRRALALESAGRQEAEAQLRQAQKLEAVGRLAGGVAHDFNNLLTAILGGAEALAEGLAPDDPRRADVDDIRGAAERAAGLTRQLLAFSRKQVLAPQHLDLREVVRGMERLLARTLGEDVIVEVRPCPAPLPIVADQGQLEQVLLNLAVNARDAMPDGGRLVLATAREPSTPGGDGAASAARAVLEVRDTGCGMTEDVLAHLFEPFFTTKGPGKGTGLGLSTVYGIVQQAGGTVQVTSAPGQGTTFRIAFPCLPGPVPDRALRPGAAAPTGTENVLVVEDHPLVRSTAVRILERAGYTVLQASDGAEALQWLTAPAVQLHLLLTDVNMPRLGGLALAAEARRHRPGLRVLLMTGYTEDGGGLRGEAGAGSGVIGKPFTPEHLLARVREALDAPEGPGSAPAPER